MLSDGRLAQNFQGQYYCLAEGTCRRRGYPETFKVCMEES